MEKTFEQKIGPYTVGARPHEDTFVGLIFRDGKRLEAEPGHASLKEASDWTLRRVNEMLGDEEVLGVVEPSDAQVLEAFRAMPEFNAGDRRMLKAHLNALNRKITATQLTKAAEYSGVQSAGNLRYGILAYEFWCRLPRHLPFDEAKNTPIWTFALADGLRKDGEWEWTMRPHIANALIEMGF